MCNKNNKIIVKGYPNKQDGLWDIPIHKQKVTTQYCISPPIRPSLYTKITMHDTKKPSLKSCTLKKRRVPEQSKTIGPLAEKKLWDDEINRQNKYNSLRKSDHKLNVILRKKQTHVELAT